MVFGDKLNNVFLTSTDGIKIFPIYDLIHIKKMAVFHKLRQKSLPVCEHSGNFAVSKDKKKSGDEMKKEFRIFKN